MYTKLIVTGICAAIIGIAVVASFGGFGRDVLDSYVMDWTVGGLMVTGIAVTVGSYIVGRRGAVR